MNPSQRIGLVGCTRSKLDHPAPAGELYSRSALFRGRRSYVEQSCATWFVVSAKHGVVSPDELLDRYNVTLVGQPTAMKRRWAQRILQELDQRFGDLAGTRFEIHAGHDYWAFGLLEGLKVRGATVEIPTRGMGQGQQLAFYKKWANRRL